MSGGGGGRVLDCQSAPVNVRPARATAGSQTNYPGHHGAQDVSLRIALLLFRHSQTRHSELSGVRRRGAPRVASCTKEPALSDPRSRRPPDGSSPGLSLTCTDRPAPETSYQSRLPAGRPSRLSCSDSIQGPQAGPPVAPLPCPAEPTTLKSDRPRPAGVGTGVTCDAPTHGSRPADPVGEGQP